MASHRLPLSPFDPTMPPRALKNRKKAEEGARESARRERHQGTAGAGRSRSRKQKSLSPAALSKVHDALKEAWTVNSSMKACLAFDAINPVRQFKRGVLDNGKKRFPEYRTEDPCDDSEVTESDESDEGVGLIQYNPQGYE